MESVLDCLVLVLLMVVTGIISRIMPRAFPAPIIQITLGALVAVFFPAFRIGFNPELFMLLFVPPLLFNDSWRFPKREFLSNSRPIITLSIGLVFFTVFGIGFLVHWLIPQIPLPAAFALAAALSPTDAVTLKAITTLNRLPDKIMHILQGEALLNDASGLVSFKFAVAAMLTGVFSLNKALFSLLVVSLGGLAVGALLTYLFIVLLGQMRPNHTQETTTENLLLLLLPFSVYFVAEKLEFSGILAAVAAGFTIDKAGFLDRTMATMRIEGRFIWGMLDITFNGLIFILLGLYLPQALKLLENTGYRLLDCFTIVAAITLALFLLRAVWIYLTLPFEAILAKHKKSSWHLPHLRVIAVISLSGVRGAIALAAILSLPAFLPDINRFPARDLMITLVVGVVLFSLLLSTLLLPLILPGLNKLFANPSHNEENEAIAAAARAAIKAIEVQEVTLAQTLNAEDTLLCKQVAQGLITGLKQYIASSVGDEMEKQTSMKALYFEETMRLAALEDARQALRSLRRQRKINNTTMMAVIAKLDLRQITLAHSHQSFQLNTVTAPNN
jgi:CPA1 family monovalent cation:H+ antiporter